MVEAPAQHRAADASKEPAPPPEHDRPVLPAASPAYLRIKSATDRFVALGALIALLPLLVYLGWRVRRESRGPALFIQPRAGRGGRPFRFMKFRTMHADVNPFGDSPSTGSDPRITPLGRTLRETSLDELPQLVNVLRGEMSLVGPRPLFLQQIAEWSPRQRSRLLVKPGLTGFSQVHGRASLTIEEKLEWDVRYVQSVSLATDLEILWRTVESVLRRRGLYQTRYSQQRARFEAPRGD